MSSDAMSILLVSALLVVAGGLVVAEFDAVFGRPITPSEKERKRNVINGFQLAGGVLLGFVLVCTFVAAIGTAFFENPGRISSRPLAFVLAVVSLTLIAFWGSEGQTSWRMDRI